MSRREPPQSPNKRPPKVRGKFESDYETSEADIGPSKPPETPQQKA
jgi:hypothetical protein